MLTVKTCAKCGVAKPVHGFGRKRLVCKACVYEKTKADRELWTPERRERERRLKEESRRRYNNRPPELLPKISAKYCRTCEDTKPVSEFRRASSYRDGYAPRCRPCDNVRNKVLYTTKDSYRTSRSRAYKKYRSTEHGKQKHLDWYFKREYGISYADYAAMLVRQGGVCALCQQPPRKSKRLAVDHDHVTGEVRGLLCQKCNNALERVDTFPAFLTRAAEYLANPPFLLHRDSQNINIVSEGIN